MKPIYFLHDFYRKNDQYIIVAKDIKNPRGVFKLEANKLVTTKRELLKKFSFDDITNIIGLATTEQPPIVSVTQNAQFKYLALLAMIYGCCLIASNICSAKLVSMFGATLTGGTIPYIFTYIVGDIISEVYGYKRIKILIWGSIITNLVVIIFIQIAIYSPPSIFWENQQEYELILGSAPRIIIASLISYLISEFLNSYVISKLKIVHNGSKLWLRIVYASLVGMTVDNFLFLSLAYAGIMPLGEMIYFSSRSYFVGLFCEWLAIPIIKMITDYLKRVENTDVFDVKTNFNPFKVFDLDYNTQNST